MNVRIDQLNTALKEKIFPVYLISGDEPLQVMEATDFVRSTCKGQGYIEREVFDVDANFDWQMFEEAAASLSLFATRRILDVRLPTARPGKQGSQVIQHYLDRLPEDTVLLITAGKLDKASKNTAWYKAIDQAGIVIQCWPVGPEQLPSWVKQRFQSRGLQPDKAVVDYVCNHVEGNLMAAAQEIDKFQLLFGPGELDFNAVREAITDNSRYSVFELADAALKGEASRTMKISNSLCSEGIEPVLIVWALAREIRLLRAAASDPGTADYTLTRSGVWKNRIDLFKSCLSRHSEHSLSMLLQRCALIDSISKGFEQGNAWDELRLLCFRLASGRRQAPGR